MEDTAPLKGFVLGGGGAKGAYEVGVWQALIERGFIPDVVTGTSIGAINGALVAQGDFDIAYKAWDNLEASSILALPREPRHTIEDTYGAIANAIVQQGGADQSPLSDLLHAIIDEKRIRESGVRLGIVTVHFPMLQPVHATLETIPEGQLIDYLLASSAFFPAMKTHTIDGKTYMDGGYNDNVPVEFAYDLGAREIVAVDLEAVGKTRRIPADKRDDMDLITLRSAYALGPMLVFDAELAQENMRLGYLDTKKAYGEIDGRVFSFKLGTAQPYFGDIEQRLMRAAADLGFSFSEEETALHAVMQRRRFYRFMSKIWGRKPENWKYALAAGEMAGLHFAMDPKQIYAPKGYHNELIERMKRALHRERQGYESNDDDDIRMQDIARGLLDFQENGSLGAADAAIYASSPVDLSAAVYMRAFCFGD